MPANFAQSGPLSPDDLLVIWQSACDKGYTDPFVGAGEGGGLEVFTQAFRSLARVSEAIDTTMGSLYILPWSGETAPPAVGPNAAVVTLTIERGGYFESPLILGAGGLVLFGEKQTDWGLPEGVPVLTGRQYQLVEDLVFQPGDAGPVKVQAVAVAPGYGFNNPLPGTLTHLYQPGAHFTQYDSNVVVVSPLPPSPPPPPPPATASIITPNMADTFLPQHVGQYVILTTGPSAGIIARIIGWKPPNLATVPQEGSTAILEMTLSFECYAPTGGAFVEGEAVGVYSGATLVGTGTLSGATLLDNGHLRVTFVVLSLNTSLALTSLTLKSNTTTATASIDQVLYDVATEMVADPPLPNVGATSWLVLDWVTDWQLEVTNVASPAGGTLAVLDELGSERGLYRSPNEDDGHYRQRISQIADVVTPNAIRRAVNRVDAATPYCFREVGSALLPGMFYDGNGDTASFASGSFTPDAWDYDIIRLTGTALTGAFVTWPIPAVLGGSGTGWQELVEWRDASNDVLAYGWFGGLKNLGGGVYEITILRRGLNNPTALAGPGDYVIGLESGATLGGLTFEPSPTSQTRRFHIWLDYTDFRAMFMVGLPPLDEGDFGLAFDTYPWGAYDAAPYEAFFDGWGIFSAQFYRQVYQAIDVARAGGVSFYLYQTNGPCS